jgi:hypothetical protein
MILRKPGKRRVRKHQRAVENFIGMDDGRHEALNVTAVEDGFFLLRRMLVRVHRKDVGDSRQIVWPLIKRRGQQFVDLSFVRRDDLRRLRQINGGFQPRFFNGQAIFVFVGA